MRRYHRVVVGIGNAIAKRRWRGRIDNSSTIGKANVKRNCNRGQRGRRDTIGEHNAKGRTGCKVGDGKDAEEGNGDRTGSSYNEARSRYDGQRRRGQRDGADNRHGELADERAGWRAALRKHHVKRVGRKLPYERGARNLNQEPNPVPDAPELRPALRSRLYALIDQGLKLLAEEEGELNKAINEVAKRLSEVESLQSQYESVIQQALAAAQARQGAQGK